MDDTLKNKHNQLLSGIYNTIRGVNKQIGDFANDIFEKSRMVNIYQKSLTKKMKKKREKIIDDAAYCDRRVSSYSPNRPSLDSRPSASWHSGDPRSSGSNRKNPI